MRIKKNITFSALTYQFKQFIEYLRTSFKQMPLKKLKRLKCHPRTSE